MKHLQKTITLIIIFSGLTLSYQNCSQQRFGFEKYEGTLCQEIDAPDLIPKVKYQFLPNSIQQPGFHHFMSTPMVGDLNRDGIPSIVATSFSKVSSDHFPNAQNSPTYKKNGVLRVINGQTGKLQFSVYGEDVSPLADFSPVLVDIDNDGYSEIVYSHYNGKKVIALNYDGSTRWTWQTWGDKDFSNCSQSFSAADLDGDGKAEILAGGFVLAENSNNQPFLKINLYEKGETLVGCSVFARSLNPNKPTEMQIIGGAKVFDKNGNALFDLSSGPYRAAADVDPDHAGLEIITSGNGTLIIQNGITGQEITRKNLYEHSDLICRPNGTPIIGGGPATLGDFNGDGKIDIAVATGRSLTIFDSKGNKTAASVTQDCSSLSTGISSFDFNGDGKQEILYSDETHFRIFHMTSDIDLHVLFEIVNPSGTHRENPIVVDVDGNGTAEIVLVSTDYSGELSRGLRVFEASSSEAWMKTLPVWNQHAYFVSNVTTALKATSWTPTNDAQAKTFRRNTQNSFYEPRCVPSNQLLNN